jgi:predicted CoA-binding protein
MKDLWPQVAVHQNEKKKISAKQSLTSAQQDKCLYIEQTTHRMGENLCQLYI